MAKIDQTYHQLLNYILEFGTYYYDPNRKGVRRVEVPRYSFYHDFDKGFPAISTKKLAWKSIVGENLWILRGETNIKYLEDNKIPIWRGDAYNKYKRLCRENHLDPVPENIFTTTIRGLQKDDMNHYLIDNYNWGDLGNVYGYQLRNFGGEFDQLSWVINEMVNNPLSTKKDVTYINPNDRANQALSPCHTGWSIIMHKDGTGFDLEFKMSSWDVFLGAPFNIAGYAFIAKLLELITGIKAKGIYCTAHNVHIYEPHLEAVKTQLERNTNLPESRCELLVSDCFKYEIEKYNMENSVRSVNSILKRCDISDFKLSEHVEYPRIKAEMIPYSK